MREVLCPRGGSRKGVSPTISANSRDRRVVHRTGLVVHRDRQRPQMVDHSCGRRASDGQPSGPQTRPLADSDVLEPGVGLVPGTLEHLAERPRPAARRRRRTSGRSRRTARRSHRARPPRGCRARPRRRSARRRAPRRPRSGSRPTFSAVRRSRSWSATFSARRKYAASSSSLSADWSAGPPDSSARWSSRWASTVLTRCASPSRKSSPSSAATASVRVDHRRPAAGPPPYLRARCSATVCVGHARGARGRAGRSGRRSRRRRGARSPPARVSRRRLPM